MSPFVSEGRPILLQTMTTFEGRGYATNQSLGLSYTVPQHCTAGMYYFRAGSTVSGMVVVSLLRDGALLRYFPIAANSAMHVPLSIVEELPARTKIEVVACGDGSGMLVLDIGYIEI